MRFRFEILARDGRARRGLVETRHGSFETPAFMPVGTAGSVKGIDPAWLAGAGAEILLANVYHLAERPGIETIRNLGGLHRFMAWPHSILCDSGGYQVMSLANRRRIDQGGVTFRSALDGRQHRLTPELVISHQAKLGSDIAMPLDVCPRYDEDNAAIQRAVTLSAAWAARSAEVERPAGQALFGIVQGGTSVDARRHSLDLMLPLPMDGFALGGVHTGESSQEALEVVDRFVPDLPDDRPRYVMGVGTPPEICGMVAMGVDMFDCVLPTRNARNGMAFVSQGRLVIKNARNARDDRPLDRTCGCDTCTRFSRAYLHHLYKAREISAAVYLTRHNLTFYLDLMRKIRHAIAAGSLDQLRRVLEERETRTGTAAGGTS